jgi:cardiolipin synthase
LDGRTAFTGGLNIGGETLVADRPRHPVRDTHFRFEGPVVAQLIEAFAEDWLFAAGENLVGGDWFPKLAEVGEAVARVILSGPDQDREKIEFMILEAIACARQSIKVRLLIFCPMTGW